MARPALNPTHRGFGFVVLEGPTTLVDWGVKRVGPAKNQETISKVCGLIERYRPGQGPTGDADVLLQNPELADSRFEATVGRCCAEHGKDRSR